MVFRSRLNERITVFDHIDLLCYLNFVYLLKTKKLGHHYTCGIWAKRVTNERTRLRG